MNRFLNVATLLAASCAGSALAQTGATGGDTTDRRAPEAIKCVKTPVTGSLMAKVRVCKTNAEWKRIREGNDEELRGMMDSYRSGSAQATSG